MISNFWHSTCANPECGATFRQRKIGRRRRYCCSPCAREGHRAVKRDWYRLMRAEGVSAAELHARKS